MRNYPTFEFDYEKEDFEKLKAEDWQTNLLKLNPEYTCWGPYEDYMSCKDSGWGNPLFFDTWKDFDFSLDELNEVVNFYFEVSRSAKNCSCCGGDGYSEEAREVVDSYYNFNGLYEDRWSDKITQDELDYLIEKNRIRPDKDGNIPSLQEVNFLNSPEGDTREAFAKGCMHDAINRGYLIKKRCERLGLSVRCNSCEGTGYVYTSDKAHVSLILWVIHPRKGAGRGVEIKRIEQEDLPDVKKFLLEARERNTNRFSGVDDIC